MIQVNKIEDNTTDYVFGVTLDGNHRYKVWFDEEYYQKLTGGNIRGEELVQKSFEFLLGKESPDSILPEFELSVIQRYFPDYEDVFKQDI